MYLHVYVSMAVGMWMATDLGFPDLPVLLGLPGMWVWMVLQDPQVLKVSQVLLLLLALLDLPVHVGLLDQQDQQDQPVHRALLDRQVPLALLPLSRDLPPQGSRPAGG